MLALVFGLFGLVIGSFLNVVILRHGSRSIGGRSACPSCHAPLAWFDMVPVLSWIALRARCRRCNKRISIQYPLVEFATAALFALIGVLQLPAVATLFALAIVALLIAIFVYDLRHKLIPDVWVYPFCAFSFLFSFLLLGDSSIWTLLLSGPVAALPLFALWAMSRGAWMGFGDVKLALGMGWLLGFPFGLVAALFAFVIGAVVSVGILLPLPHILTLLRITSLEGREARFTMKSEVPFGPFLIASTMLVWFALLFGLPIPLFS